MIGPNKNCIHLSLHHPPSTLSLTAREWISTISRRGKSCQNAGLLWDLQSDQVLVLLHLEERSIDTIVLILPLFDFTPVFPKLRVSWYAYGGQRRFVTYKL